MNVGVDKILSNKTYSILNLIIFYFRQVESQEFNHVGPLVQSLVGYINELLTISKAAQVDCNGLTSTSDRLKDIASKPILNHSSLIASITDLGKYFTKLVDDLLANQIKVVKRF